MRARSHAQERAQITRAGGAYNATGEKRKKEEEKKGEKKEKTHRVENEYSLYEENRERERERG